MIFMFFRLKKKGGRNVIGFSDMSKCSSSERGPKRESGRKVSWLDLQLKNFNFVRAPRDSGKYCS